MIWGGAEDGCEHKWETVVKPASSGAQGCPKLEGGKATQEQNTATRQAQMSQFCLRCGAWRGALGLEPTWQLFIQHLCQCAEEWHRVLKKTGSLFINMGDSFFGGKGQSGQGSPEYQAARSNVSINKPRNHIGGPGRTRPQDSRIGSNLSQSIREFLEYGVFAFGRCFSIRITAEGEDISSDDGLSPNGVFLRLLGSQRVSIKQGDKHLGQIFIGINTICDCWIPVRGVSYWIDRAHTQIIVDVPQDSHIIISESNAKNSFVFGINPPRHLSPVDIESKMPLTVNESNKPVTEVIGDTKPIWETFSLNSLPKGIPYIYLVETPVALSESVLFGSRYLGNLRIIEASPEKLDFLLGDSGLHYSFACVTHAYSPDSWFTPISLLYHKTKKDASVNKPKQKMMIPSRLAIALQEQGWVLRDSIVWYKGKEYPDGRISKVAMPESVKRRFACSYEMVMRFVKTPKMNYYVNERTLESRDRPPKERVEGQDFEWQKHSKCEGKGCDSPRCKDGLIKYSFWHGVDQWFDLDTVRKPHLPASLERIKKPWHGDPNGYYSRLRTDGEMGTCHPAGANPGDIWIIQPEPFKLEHYAVWPSALCEMMIKVGCPKEVCPNCGKPRERIRQVASKRRIPRYPSDSRIRKSKMLVEPSWNEYETIGWSDCKCGEGFVPGVVLDPFGGGSGRLAKEARKLGRQAIIVDLKEEYLKMSKGCLVYGEKELFKEKKRREKTGMSQGVLW